MAKLAKPFAERIAEDRRLMILLLLKASQCYEASAPMIAATLGDLGHVVSQEQLCADFTWLKEQGLITSRDIGGVLQLAALTLRGLETATGIVATPGVRRPSPREREQ